MRCPSCAFSVSMCRLARSGNVPVRVYGVQRQTLLNQRICLAKVLVSACARPTGPVLVYLNGKRSVRINRCFCAISVNLWERVRKGRLGELPSESTRAHVVRHQIHSFEKHDISITNAGRRCETPNPSNLPRNDIKVLTNISTEHVIEFLGHTCKFR